MALRQCIANMHVPSIPVRKTTQGRFLWFLCDWTESRMKKRLILFGYSTLSTNVFISSPSKANKNTREKTSNKTIPNRNNENWKQFSFLINYIIDHLSKHLINQRIWNDERSIPFTVELFKTAIIGWFEKSMKIVLLKTCFVPLAIF